MKHELTQDELKSLLWYEPETGVFRWRNPTGQRVKPWATASHITNQGYVQLQIYKKRYLAHRIAWMYVYGAMPEHFIDHINGVKNDNRIINLRIATKKQNSENVGLRKTNTSGFKGVSFHKAAKKWVAHIGHNGKLKYLGCFTTPEQASEAYEFAVDMLHTHRPTSKLKEMGFV